MTASSKVAGDQVVRRVAGPVARNVVPRRRLFDLLDAASATPVVLICAPAGYGKSLLVASWLEERPIGPAAWVNLGSAGEGARQAWSRIVSALLLASPESAEELERIAVLALSAPQEVAARLGRWVTEQQDDTYLVLDDLHAVVDQEVHDELVELAAAGAGRLHLLVLTRHDPPWPLHRLRLDGLLQDLRTDSLAFDVAEAAMLFDLLDVWLSSDWLAELVARTEGWAVGLRLAAMGASTSADPEHFVQALSGRNEYIADYLMREVYDGLSPEWREFLIRLCVVDDVCVELAEALGGGPDSRCRLAELARQNIFTHQLGERPGWYRLHPLLLDFLRSRAAGAREQRALHRRAAAWFHDRDEPWEALRHAVAAQDWELAGAIVGRHVVSWTVQQPPGGLDRLLESVPREAILTEPGLAIGRAAALSMLGRPAELDELVTAAEARLDVVSGVDVGSGVDGGSGRRRRRYEFLIDLIAFGRERWRGDLEALLAGCRNIPTDAAVLADLGLTDWVAIRTLLIGNIGTAELWTGERRAAAEHLAEAARLDGNRSVALPALNAQANLAYLRWADGDLTDAEQTGRRAIDHFVRLGIPTAVQARSAYLALAGVALDRDDGATAARWLETARQGGPDEPHTEFAADLMAARLLAARGETFEAIAATRTARRGAAAYPLPAYLVDTALLLEAQLLMLAGNSAASEAVAATAGMPLAAIAPDRETVRATVDVHLARARRAVVAGTDGPALVELERALAVAAAEQLRQPFLASRPELTDLLRRRIELGTEDPAFAVDLLGRMIDRSSGANAAPSAVLVPLTERENNILRYLATTLSNKEIADALYVSVNTVKTHQRSIYAKLGARDRREAVCHAREVGLL